MWHDPIVEEIRRIREEYAAKFNYDIRAMCRDLMERQGKDGHKVVSFPPKPAKPVEPAASKQHDG